MQQEQGSQEGRAVVPDLWLDMRLARAGHWQGEGWLSGGHSLRSGAAGSGQEEVVGCGCWKAGSLAVVELLLLLLHEAHQGGLGPCDLAGLDWVRVFYEWRVRFEVKLTCQMTQKGRHLEANSHVDLRPQVGHLPFLLFEQVLVKFLHEDTLRGAQSGLLFCQQEIGHTRHNAVVT